MHNILFSSFTLLLGIRFIHHAYVKPHPLSSYNEKGYIAGASFILMSILSFSGKFNLYDITTKLIRDSLKLNGENGGASFAVFIGMICSVLFLTYYRPDKMVNKYRVSKNDLAERTNILSNYLLFYFGFLMVIIYLISKIKNVV